LALVVTADDFGIGVPTSRGIILAHQKGPVTATSFMVITGQYAAESVALLAEAPNLDVGLHLVLTQCGHPPLVATKSSGLVDRDGNFLSNARLWLRAWLGRLNVAAVAEEIAAQAELFKKLVGRRPDYVDGHHHAHQLPTIRQALMQVIGKSNLLPPVTRTTVEAPGMLKHVSTARTHRRAANFLGKRARRKFAAGGVWSNDFYFGMLSSEDLHRSFPWAAYWRHVPKQGVVEWIVHPGYADPSLEGRDGYRAERERELEALVSPAGVQEWKTLSPYLARKSKLATGMNSRSVEQ
jgi:predicted glycoside hydrolase/deacetylase ChbG (UPF0249 family)